MPAKNIHPELFEVGQRFRSARKKVGLSGIAMADLAGMDQPGVSRFERGEKGFETSRLIQLLNAAFKAGINIEYVITGTGPEVRQPLAATDDPELLGHVVAIATLIQARQLGETPPRTLKTSGKNK